MLSKSSVVSMKKRYRRFRLFVKELYEGSFSVYRNFSKSVVHSYTAAAVFLSFSSYRA